MKKIFLASLLVICISSPFCAAQSTIVDVEGKACMGDDKSRNQTEQAAITDAKRRAVEFTSTFLKTKTEVKDYVVEKDLLAAYANAEVKVIQELEKVWYKDAAAGDCYKAKIKAEVIPDEKAMQKAAQAKSVTDNPAAPVAKMEVASKEKMAFPLPDEPSIAVLPFVNMSGDPKQEFFSDGITEEIITALSKIHHLFVISRQSTFSYKGKPVKVKQVSEELGVRYVLEGSLQRSGDRIRINAQLIDALTGRHIWAERYNRDLTDLFALQDEITMKILTAIRVKLTEGEQASSYEKHFKGKKGLDCYLKFLEGASYLGGYNIEGTKVGRRIAEEAIEMCPENPVIYTLMGWVNYLEYWMGLGTSPRESIEKGMELTQKVLAMDNSLSVAHGWLSLFYTLKREHEKAIAEAERALALDPGGAIRHVQYGMSLYYGGRPEEAIPVFQKAIRLNPLGESSSAPCEGAVFQRVQIPPGNFRSSR